MTYKSNYTLAWILLFALLLRLPGLGESLWFDETYYTSVVLRGSDWWQATFHDVHPPLYPLLMLAWNSLVGEGEIRLRLPSLLAGLITIALGYRMGQACFGHSVGCLTALFMACAPAHIWYSQENKANMTMVAFSTAAIWLGYCAYKAGSTRSWACLALCSAAALCTHTFAVPAMAVLYGWLWWVCRGQRRRPLLWVTASVAVSAGLVVARQIGVVREIQPGHLRPFTIDEMYKFLFCWLPHGSTLHSSEPGQSLAEWMTRLSPGWFLVDAFYGLLLLLGSLALLRLARSLGWEIPSLILLLFWTPILGSLIATHFHPRFYLERNLLEVFPFYAILIALGCLSGGSHASKLSRVGLLAALQLLALGNLWWWKAEQWTVYKPNPNWRGLCRQLTQVLASDPDRPALLFETTGYPQTVRFYLPDALLFSGPGPLPPSPLVVISLAQPDQYSRLGEILAAQKARRFYVVHELVWPQWSEELLLRLRGESGYQEEGLWIFKGLRLHRFRLLHAPPETDKNH